VRGEKLKDGSGEKAVLFSVIYSADSPNDVDVARYAPPQAQALWQQTEGDEGYEYGYLEGRWEGGHHGKWVALLDREQFERFVAALGLYAEDVETLGSLGAPGFGFGWAPALSFTASDPDAILSAYVTPLPETRRRRYGDRDWRRVYRAVVGVYGRNKAPWRRRVASQVATVEEG
jgi:hypothetical protein